MNTKPLSTQEMLEWLNERSNVLLINAHNCLSSAVGRSELDSHLWQKHAADYNRQATIMETMAAILEVQDYRGFRHAKKAQGVFTIRLMLANGKSGTLAEFRDANPVVAWLSAYEAIRGRETASP